MTILDQVLADLEAESAQLDGWVSALDDDGWHSVTTPEGWTVAHQIGWFRGSGFYASLNEKRAPIERRATSLMQRFVDDNLPPFDSLRAVTVTFPWNRMFEASVEPAAN